ncbi:hypothetical protein PFISCL1PPCAC_17844 [Pristionchus fissidentatus]|uniref:G protein-coupled receptor n=1 Tax=Pristionchus fissidentatus TaxID=1538716 RepID=A0AAV5W915_9BILA|nr:hypothetical protein PFISCL1PPCAC_17844 [Pristionchus fissidentatus]
MLKQIVAHGSLVMLLMQHCGWNLMLALTVLIDSSITAYTFATWKQPSDLIALSDGYSCFHRKIWHIYAVYGTVTSMFAITIERIFASKNYKNYEKTSRRLGCALSFGQFLLASLFEFGAIVTFDFTETRAHCFVVTRRGEKYHRPLAVSLLILEIVSLVIFHRLLRLNQRRLQADTHYGLSERYQITENVRALKLLVPVVISHISLSVIVASVFSIFSSIHLEPHTRAIAEESLGFLHAHCVIVPLFMFIRHRRKEEKDEQTSRVNHLHGAALMDEHDRAITKNW